MGWGFNVQPLPKELYEKLLAAGVTDLYLDWSGGSDEGFLQISFGTKDDRSQQNAWYLDDDAGNDSKVFAELEQEVDSWAWKTHSYSGAGDGTDFGDDVHYDLVAKKVTSQEWSMEKKYDSEEEGVWEEA